MSHNCHIVADTSRMSTLSRMNYCTEATWKPFGARVVADSRATDAWLQARAERLTASQAAGAIGMSRWTDFDRILAEKRGEVSRWDPSQPARFGQWREECNLRILGEVLGVVPVANTLLLEREGRPEMACTPDGLLELPPGAFRAYLFDEWPDTAQRTRFYALMAEYGRCPVDVKSVGAKNDYLWRDGAPTEYEVQMQCDLAVLRWPFGLVAAFIDSCRLRCCLVERDEITSELLWDAAARLREALTAR